MSLSQRFLVIVILGLTISRSYADECKEYKDSKCECAYTDGSGYSLKTLVEANKTKSADNGKGLTFLFSPCMDSKSWPPELIATNNECKDGFSLCVYDHQSKNATLLGTQKNIGFLEDNKQKMSITFKKGNDNISSVILECAQFYDDSTLFAPEDTDSSQPHLILFSNLSCKKQIYEVKEPGFFSTFFLVLFILFLLYVVFGMLYQYFLVGARGFEILPNYDFWCKVWLSTKLGFLYLKNGCRVLPTEDSYDAI